VIVIVSGFCAVSVGDDESSSLNIGVVVATPVGMPVMVPVARSKARPAGMDGELAARLHV
jgi:hypothetical protein